MISFEQIFSEVELGKLSSADLAEVKFFLVADSHIRAKRRQLELKKMRDIKNEK